MSWIDILKDQIPDTAKDIKLNLDAVISRGKLPNDVAQGCALSAAISSGNQALVSIIASNIEDEEVVKAAESAAFLMAQNNMWYPYIEMTGDANIKGLPAQLRMNVITSSGGTSKDKFEAYSLTASIIGKCHFCIRAHYDVLKKEGYSLDQLMDIGRIASVVNAVSKLPLKI